MDDLSTKAIAEFWLSDPHARSMLNQQLAQLLRWILERPGLIDEPQFLFCPICRHSLVEYDPDDIWVKGLRCKKDHLWALRGGHFFHFTETAHIELYSDSPDKTANRLVAAWLTPNPTLETNLHESIRRVLLSSGKV